MRLVHERSRMTYLRRGDFALKLLIFPAIVFLSACAGTAPAPVVDLSQPAARSLTPNTAARTDSVDRNATAGNGVIVSALAEPPAEINGMPVEQGSGQPNAAVVSISEDPPQELNPAVLRLLNVANREQQKGNYSRAAASIERALKIEPDNAWLWHRLALARFAQGQMGQAAALAAKSNTLVSATSGHRALLAENWLLIAKVHAQRGEHIAAKAATDRARRIQSGSG